MTTINEIFRSFGPEYLQRYANLMPHIHRKVIDAIIGCRTEVCGVALYECEKCGQLHRVYRSCLPVRAARRQACLCVPHADRPACACRTQTGGNRHCPTCQHHKTRLWLEKQIKRQLPGHHFLLTFTVPENLRRFIRALTTRS